MKLQTIYKKTKTGATQEWTIEVSDNHLIQYKVMVDLHKQLNHLVIIPKDGLRNYHQQQIRQPVFQWYKINI